MLRRMSLHACGIAELGGTYVWDDLSAPTFQAACVPGFPEKRREQKSFRIYAAAGILHMDHLANLADNSLPQRDVFFLSQSMRLDTGEVEKKLNRMLRRHRIEWEAFLSSLGEHSFINRMIGRVTA
jgi:hypothetical protein